MKKFWLLSQFTLLTLTASAFGEEAGCLSADNNEVARGYVLGEPYRWGKSSKDCTNCCDPEMNYRLPADYSGLDTFVEYLLWQVQEQASHFAADHTPSTFDNALPSTYLQGKIRSEGFDWSSGVRLGLGYSFNRDIWQLQAQYTWYKTDGQRAYKVQTPLTDGGNFVGSNYLMETLATVTTNGTAKASSSASFSYQMFDLMLASSFLATEQIQFNYAFGSTFGYIKENWDVTYIAAPTPSVGSNTYWHNHWRIGGGGFKVAMDTNWHMGRGFGMFGKVGFSALLGQYKNRARATIDGGVSTFGTTQQHTTYEGLMLLPMTQFIFGFDWCKTFTDCWVSAIKFSVAGEFNHLSDLQQVFKTTYVDGPTQDKPTSRDVGSVYMYGGTAHFGVDY